MSGKRNLPAMPPGARASVPAKPRNTVKRLQRATHAVDRLADRLIPYDPNNEHSPDQRARPTILMGVALLVFLFGFLGLWAALVPLASGAVAGGKVMPDSNRKEIQHLEGGIIKEILVREGQEVTEGQPLLRLENTTAEARAGLIRGQYLSARGTEARLIAERDNRDSITFPEELTKLETTDAQVKEIIDTQRRLFDTRRQALKGSNEVMQQKMAQSEQEIRGYREQVNASTSQINLLGEEITVVQDLLAKGNALRPRLLALQRSQADLMGQRGQAQAMISRASQTINESRINILNQKNEYVNRANSELKDVQSQLSDLSEQTLAASDVVRRVEVKAPLAGTVTGLAVHTVGGVVQPGQTLMTLVPADDKLIVEARINPTDIDSVRPGLGAQVRLTAFHMRSLRPVEGTVTTVSADRFDNERTGEAYYTARVEIPQSELKDVGDLKLTAGMPAEVLIVTGSRTMLSYLVRPIRESFGHAFHEE